MPPAIYLMGPTASGKTDLALIIANRFNCEIVSVDSALIYRDMNIGTAKPSSDILAGYPHHLVDILDPTDTYSVADFCNALKTLLADIYARERIPLLVGGSMLYFNALDKGLAKLPASNPIIRAALLKEQQQKGLAHLHQQLCEVDPVSATRVHPNDPQRTLRALEVYRITGQSMTSLMQDTTPISDTIKPLKLCINPSERNILHQRIAARFNKMLEADFVSEVEVLRQRYPKLSPTLPSMRCVGYRQVWQYLDKEIDYLT